MFEQYSRSGIINVDELHALRDSPFAPSVVILDATFAMPGNAPSARQGFENRHINGAQFFDIDCDFADQSSSLPHMLCNAAQFQERARNLGISHNSLIVVYGQNGMIMGPPRAWWSFKTFGHDAVAVLNGGLPAWISAGYETQQGSADICEHGDFEAALNPALICTASQVDEAIGKHTILDARPQDRFEGTAPEPREGLQSGHIPQSRNLPCSQLIEPQTGEWLTKAALANLLQERGVEQKKPTILTCGSGVTACAIALALHHTGHDNWRVYDGSWAEWGKNRDLNTQVIL